MKLTKSKILRSAPHKLFHFGLKVLQHAGFSASGKLQGTTRDRHVADHDAGVCARRWFEVKCLKNRMNIGV